MVGSEVYSSEVKKTEILMENFRRAIGSLLTASSLLWWQCAIFLHPSYPILILLLGLRIKENKEVYEGEVTELTAEETENTLGGYGIFLIKLKWAKNMEVKILPAHARKKVSIDLIIIFQGKLLHMLLLA